MFSLQYVFKLQNNKMKSETSVILQWLMFHATSIQNITNCLWRHSIVHAGLPNLIIDRNSDRDQLLTGIPVRDQLLTGNQDRDQFLTGDACMLELKTCVFSMRNELVFNL